MLSRPKRFEEWLDIYFRIYDGVDSPWDKFPPGGDDDGPSFEGSDEEIAELFIYTMLTSGTELKSLTGHQLGNGLYNLLTNNFADVASTIRNGHLPERTVMVAIQSIEVLYRDCLTPRAPTVLGHRNEPSPCEPMSFLTYMLWDTSPLSHWPEETSAQRMYPILTQVMASALESSNPAVVESGLHGLGHAVFYIGDPAVSAIDRFLHRRRGKVRDELVSYALQARTGCIQ